MFSLFIWLRNMIFGGNIPFKIIFTTARFDYDNSPRKWPAIGLYIDRASLSNLSPTTTFSLIPRICGILCGVLLSDIRF